MSAHVGLIVSGLLAVSAFGGAYNYQVASGWNLLGTSENIENLQPFGVKGSVIWVYEDGWQQYDPQSGGSIRGGQGFWFKANSTGSVDVILGEGATRSYSVVDSGQETCFDSNGQSQSCSGSGQDGAYNGNAMSYSVNGDLVTDNVTGLMWTRSVDTNNDGTYDANDKKSQSAAITYCSNLTLGGYSDWRLPDIKTLYSLMNFKGLDPSGYDGSDPSALTPFIDDTAFEAAFGDTSAGERLIDGQWATTSIYTDTVMGGQTCMFGLNLVDGRIKCYPTQNKTYYVYCVRGNESYGQNSFIDNGDQTITDSATGLMWEKADSGPVEWDSAITQCENATTGGHTNWRLPNVKELQSLVDYTRSPGKTSSAAIDPLFTTTSFQSEAGQTDYGWYWSSTTHATYTGNGLAAVYVSFGRALGYFMNSWQDVHGAGAQRSDPKKAPTTAQGGYVSATTASGESVYTFGPQGDVLRGSNYVRCVRDGD